MQSAQPLSGTALLSGKDAISGAETRVSIMLNEAGTLGIEKGIYTSFEDLFDQYPPGFVRNDWPLTFVNPLRTPAGISLLLKKKGAPDEPEYATELQLRPGEQVTTYISDLFPAARLQSTGSFSGNLVAASDQPFGVGLLGQAIYTDRLGKFMTPPPPGKGAAIQFFEPEVLGSNGFVDPAIRNLSTRRFDLPISVVDSEQAGEWEFFLTEFGVFHKRATEEPIFTPLFLSLGLKASEEAGIAIAYGSKTYQSPTAIFFLGSGKVITVNAGGFDTAEPQIKILDANQIEIRGVTNNCTYWIVVDRIKEEVISTGASCISFALLGP